MSNGVWIVAALASLKYVTHESLEVVATCLDMPFTVSAKISQVQTPVSPMLHTLSSPQFWDDAVIDWPST